MTIPTDALNEEYTIHTPENVSIGYAVAGIGNRFIAALVDSALLGAALIVGQLLLLVALALAGGPGLALSEATMNWQQGMVVAVYALATFSLIWGYYILFEWLWQGQTPGKRVSKIRVVRMDGSPPRFLDIAVRNLVRIVDFLPVGYGIGLVVMFFNRESRRLGDLAAGVMVVKDGGALRLEDVTGPVRARRPQAASAEPARERDASSRDSRGEGRSAFHFTTLRRLRVADVELIQETLGRFDAGTLEAVLLIRLAGIMAHKTGAQDAQGRAAMAVDIHGSRLLLESVLDAYRDSA